MGASSLVDLKAQYYKTQEEVCHATLMQTTTHDFSQARQARDAGINPAERRRKQSDGRGDSNTGVGERDRKDRLHVQVRCLLGIGPHNTLSQEQTPGERAAESYAALERKAALYDRLAAGGYNSDDEARYNVDFLYKEAQRAEPVDEQGSWVPQRFGRGGVAAPDTMGQASHAATGVCCVDNDDDEDTFAVCIIFVMLYCGICRWDGHGVDGNGTCPPGMGGGASSGTRSRAQGRRRPFSPHRGVSPLY